MKGYWMVSSKEDPSWNIIGETEDFESFLKDQKEAKKAIREKEGIIGFHAPLDIRIRYRVKSPYKMQETI